MDKNMRNKNVDGGIKNLSKNEFIEKYREIAIRRVKKYLKG